MLQKESKGGKDMCLNVSQPLNEHNQEARPREPSAKTSTSVMKFLQLSFELDDLIERDKLLQYLQAKTANTYPVDTSELA